MIVFNLILILFYSPVKTQLIIDNIVEISYEINLSKLNINTIREDSLNVNVYNYLKLDANKKYRDYQIKNYTAVYNMKEVWNYLELKYNIPKAISISFWIQETGWGKSNLFVNHFNLGGIKGRKGFRKYKTLLEGINAWGKVLTSSRYKVKEGISIEEYLKVYMENKYWGESNPQLGYEHRLNHIKNLKLND